MTLTLIRCEAMRTAWRLLQARSEILRRPGSVAETSLSLEDREALVRELERTLQEKYPQYCNTNVPYQLVSYTVARLVIGRFWLVAHYQHDPKKDNEHDMAPDPDENADVRDRLFSVSIDILELSDMLLHNEGLSK